MYICELYEKVLNLNSLANPYGIKFLWIHNNRWNGLICYRHRDPFTHRETLREPRMLLTRGCPLNGGDTNQILAFPPER